MKSWVLLSIVFNLLVWLTKRWLGLIDPKRPVKQVATTVDYDQDEDEPSKPEKTTAIVVIRHNILLSS